MDRANTALSKKQRDDGTWTGPVLVDAPSGCKQASKDVDNVLEDLIKPFGELSVGGKDYNSTAWDLKKIASSLLARCRCNLQKAARPRPIQPLLLPSHTAASI
eukprot:2736574-Pleurochrysis_carterae.AAC.2